MSARAYDRSEHPHGQPKPKPPPPPWDIDHHTQETDHHGRVLKAWNQHGQTVYMAQSNASREMRQRWTGPGKATPTFYQPSRWAQGTAA